MHGEARAELAKCAQDCRHADTTTFRLRHLIDDSPMTSVGALKNSVSRSLGHISLSSYNIEGLNKHFS